MCRCDECLLWTYKDVDGLYRSGRVLSAQVISTHVAVQRAKRRLEAEAAREAAEDDSSGANDDTVSVTQLTTL